MSPRTAEEAVSNQCRCWGYYAVRSVKSSTMATAPESEVRIMMTEEINVQEDWKTGLIGHVQSSCKPDVLATSPQVNKCKLIYLGNSS